MVCQFTSYVARAEWVPDLHFPLFHSAPSGLEQHMPFPPKRHILHPAPSDLEQHIFHPAHSSLNAPPSFTLSDTPSMDFSSDEELEIVEPTPKKHKAFKSYVPKRVQFNPFKKVLILTYTELPGSKPWKLLPIKQRADEDGILYPHYWAKLKHHKKMVRDAKRGYVKQGCNCKKDNEGKDSVCYYCSRLHSRIMLKTHERDEDDLGMKLDINSCSALCKALDLHGMPPAAPTRERTNLADWV